LYGHPLQAEKGTLFLQFLFLTCWCLFSWREQHSFKHQTNWFCTLLSYTELKLSGLHGIHVFLDGYGAARVLSIMIGQVLLKS
jgi:hypothetical protein